MGEFSEWIDDHIYVPVIVGVVIVFFIILLGYFCYCRKRRHYKGSYYVYKRLEHEAGVAEQMNQERRTQLSAIKDSVFLNCQYYLRSQPYYKNMVQANELGSRIDKHWFQVTDFRTNQDCLMTSIPPNTASTLPFTPNAAKTLKDLFSLLKHPHIFPMASVNFAVEQNLILCFQPVAPKGSLKDVIYQSRYNESWYNKYSRIRRGLSVQNIKIYGKQILSGLMYLEEKGFPSHGNIQTGNVIFDNGICRLTGYENKFLGNTSRLYNMVKKKLKEENKDALDSISFGHVLYEMAFGYELTSPHPEPQHLIGHQSPEMVNILNFIFENSSGLYPSIKEIDAHDFFIKVNLKELQRYNPVKIHMTDQMKNLLKSVKKGKPMKPPKPSTGSKKKKLKSQTSLANGESRSTVASPTPSAKNVFSFPSATSPPPPPPPPCPPSAAPPSSVQRSGAPPPPPPPSAPLPGPSSSGRGALLGDIRKGMKLKKAVTNDRSGLRV